MYQEHEVYMVRAYQLAAKSVAEGGCPFGGVLVDNESGKILGEGHNGLVQEDNPIVHGELAALRSAGRIRNHHRTTMYATHQPCFMCAGAIIQFGIPRVVIGDVVHSPSDETIHFLRSKGVEVIVLDPTVSKAAADCEAIATRFSKEKPDLWLDGWGRSK